MILMTDILSWTFVLQVKCNTIFSHKAKTCFMTISFSWIWLHMKTFHLKGGSTSTKVLILTVELVDKKKASEQAGESSWQWCMLLNDLIKLIKVSHALYMFCIHQSTFQLLNSKNAECYKHHNYKQSWLQSGDMYQILLKGLELKIVVLRISFRR